MGKVLQFPGTEKPVVLEAHDPNSELNGLIAEVIAHEQKEDLKAKNDLEEVRLQLKNRIRKNNTQQDWADFGTFNKITGSFIKG